MEWVNLVIATGQNGLAMNRTVRQIAEHYIKGREIPEGVLNRLEAGIRAFDPCLSCSTHAVGDDAAARPPDRPRRCRVRRSLEGLTRMAKRCPVRPSQVRSSSATATPCGPTTARASAWPRRSRPGTFPASLHWPCISSLPSSPKRSLPRSSPSSSTLDSPRMGRRSPSRRSEPSSRFGRPDTPAILDPCSLWPRMLYGHHPRAWLVTVPAVDLSVGEGLSRTAMRGIEGACGRIRRILDGR